MVGEIDGESVEMRRSSCRMRQRVGQHAAQRLQRVQRAARRRGQAGGRRLGRRSSRLRLRNHGRVGHTQQRLRKADGRQSQRGQGKECCVRVRNVRQLKGPSCPAARGGDVAQLTSPLATGCAGGSKRPEGSSSRPRSP